MPATSCELHTHLEMLNIPYQTYEHPPLFTVEDSKQVHDDLPGVHCKNLFLKDKKQKLWLVVARHDAEINLKELKNKIGSAHLSFGKPDLLMEILGVIPGSVTPFALINDAQQRVTVILDKMMMAGELVNYHPLNNEMTTAITPDDLRRFIADCGHDFHEVDL